MQRRGTTKWLPPLSYSLTLLWDAGETLCSKPTTLLFFLHCFWCSPLFFSWNVGVIFWNNLLSVAHTPPCMVWCWNIPPIGVAAGSRWQRSVSPHKWTVPGTTWAVCSCQTPMPTGHELLTTCHQALCKSHIASLFRVHQGADNYIYVVFLCCAWSCGRMPHLMGDSHAVCYAIVALNWDGDNAAFFAQLQSF